MKISIITPTYNNSGTIGSTIESILSQTHTDIEHIIIDNCSTDGTLHAIRQAPYPADRQPVIVCEPDGGIYNAINKGIAMATGDIVGILHADDTYPTPDVLEQISTEFTRSGCEMIYGDISWRSTKAPQKRIRYFCARDYNPQMLKTGIAPPHPSLYVHRRILYKIGNYREDYKIAADFEMFVRLMLIHGIRGSYLPVEIVAMSPDGRSGTLYHRLVTNTVEKMRALRQNGIKTSLPHILRRYIFNLRQYDPDTWNNTLNN